MRSRKQLCIAAFSLCSALAVVMAFTLHSPIAHAAKHIGPSHPAGIAQPAAYVASPTLPEFAADTIPLDISGGQRVTATMLRNVNPLVPDVEEFTLTPPDPDQATLRTTLSVRFAQEQAEKLAGQIPMVLGQQNVVMQRSLDNPSVYSAQVNFNWTSFIGQQQRRKRLAAQGKTVALYSGRDFLGREKMQFIEPAQIEKALEQHQSISFTRDVLLGGTGVTVVPDHELMIINPAVVEDTENGSGRTYDACLQNVGQNTGNPQGAWTFQTLWMAALNTTTVTVAEQALDDFLYNWNNPNLKINTFTVITRPAMGKLPSPTNITGSGFLANWPVDRNNLCTEPSGQTYCPSLQAPVRLNAIVNRIDLSDQPNQTPGGELRFVFGFTAGNAPNQACLSEGPQPSSGPPFNIIFEYHVPSSYTTPGQWAQQWALLPQMDFGTCPTCYIPLLQSDITDNVVKKNSCMVNGSANTCLFHIRTNEVLLTGSPAVWELREFGVNYGSSGNPNTISEIMMDQTPSDSFNFGGGSCFRGMGTDENGEPPCTSLTTFTVNYLNTNQTMIIDNLGVLPLIPQTITGPPQMGFQGGSSLNAFENGPGTIAFSYWNVCAFNVDKNCNVHLQMSAYEARRYFSLNTCNGCHGDETNNNFFQQVFNRLPQQQASLSNFLVGCVNAQGSCTANPDRDSCTVGTMGNQPGDQCELNTPGQELVQDPANASNGTHPYGDIVYRQGVLQTDLGQGNELFLPFLRPHVGVH